MRVLFVRNAFLIEVNVVKADKLNPVIVTNFKPLEKIYLVFNKIS